MKFFVASHAAPRRAVARDDDKRDNESFLNDAEDDEDDDEVTTQSLAMLMPSTGRANAGTTLPFATRSSSTAKTRRNNNELRRFVESAARWVRHQERHFTAPPLQRLLHHLVTVDARNSQRGVAARHSSTATAIARARAGTESNFRPSASVMLDDSRNSLRRSIVVPSSSVVSVVVLPIRIVIDRVSGSKASSDEPPATAAPADDDSERK